MLFRYSPLHFSSDLAFSGHLHRGAYQPHLSAPWIWIAAFLGSVTCHQSGHDRKPNINVQKSICEHCTKHHAEQCWCHNTALFDSVSHQEWFRVLALILNACLHAAMKLPHHCYEPEWTTKPCHYFPKPISTDCVKCFGYVDKGRGPHFALNISLV